MTIQPKTFQQHAQSIVGGVVISLILWVGWSVNQISSQIVRLEEQMANSQNMASSQYARLQRHDNKIQDLTIRVDRLERAE